MLDEPGNRRLAERRPTAYGIDDRLARADALVAAVLPKPRVYIGPGEHKWVTWKQLFIRFLDESELKTRCQ